MNEQKWRDGFWIKVNKDGPIPSHCPELGKCWVWTGRKDGNGYGSRQWKNRYLRTHRIAWEWMNGKILNGLRVLHKCDNPPCCNPAHLFLGTQADNVRDMIAKNRHCTKFPMNAGASHWAHKHPEQTVKGEDHGNAKLTDEKVRLMFRLREQGIPGTKIARQLKLGNTVVYHVLKGKGWRHLGLSLSKEALSMRCKKLTPDNIREIFTLNSQGKSRNEIADHFSVSRASICLILSRKQWAHVEIK